MDLNLIYQLLNDNLDAVFFVYGLAFLVMGIAVLVQPKKDSGFSIANILWLLAAFGITHGTNEMLDMWVIIKGRYVALDLVRWFFLIISYFFLFEFGRQLFRLNAAKSPAGHKKIALLLGRWISPAIGLFILAAGIMSSDFWKVGTIWTRYLLGLPGGILIGYGFISYYNLERQLLQTLKVKKYFYSVGLSFLIYGILGGVIVPKWNFFPSSWLNTDSFFSTVKIPVQAFRAVCAIVATWAISGMLGIFNWETWKKLEDAKTALSSQLKESEKRYSDITENSRDIIHCLDPEGFIIFANKRGYEHLGYPRGEVIGKHFKELYTPQVWDDMEKGLERLKREGVVSIENGEIIKKNGDKLCVEIYMLALYENGELLGAILTIKDITDRIKLENELRKRIKELEEFYEMAVGRELKMAELKEEIEMLKKELREHKNV